MSVDGYDSKRLRPIAAGLARLAGSVAAFRDLAQRRRAPDDPLLDAVHAPLHGMNAIIEEQFHNRSAVISTAELDIYVQATLRTVLALAEGATDDEEVVAARDVGRAAEDLLRFVERT